MESVFKVTVTGTHRTKGTDERETYMIDLGMNSKLGDAEGRAKQQAKEMAYSDGISPQYATVQRTSDYVECPHCGDPIPADEFE
ncbi:hypothetical protein EGO51_07170 [Haloarcula hispanica]|uniref:Uncharacterized protein n=1 Tax=Haloarcula hispanica TaxID=51589 RepID=A0A5J5LJG7_HALHI|nr:hypothetical protein [Haloarcula hispanica]KAA9409588.1 hypothetical protein EGO51_07170 [Haloarcula hispanica]